MLTRYPADRTVREPEKRWVEHRKLRYAARSGLLPSPLAGSRRTLRNGGGRGLSRSARRIYPTRPNPVAHNPRFAPEIAALCCKSATGGGKAGKRRGTQRTGQRNGAAERPRPPPTRHFDRSPGPPGRGGAEKSGGRSFDATGFSAWPASVASQISPLAPLGRNDEVGSNDGRKAAGTVCSGTGQRNRAVEQGSGTERQNSPRAPNPSFRPEPRPLGRGGVEESGPRSVDATGSGIRPASVASQISPLAPLRSK